MSIKVTSSKRNNTDREQISVKTKKAADAGPQSYAWYRARGKDQLAQQLLSTVAFLKDQQNARFRQVSLYARLYGNIPLANFAGQSGTKFNPQQRELPVDRPTMNVVQSCVDTLVSRISQAKPSPTFLTDNGLYKQRKLAKQLNGFIAGELYQTDAHEKAQQALRDAAILGTGVIKVLERDNKVVLERTLHTELYVDSNDSFYGEPRSLYQMKLVDRSVLEDMLPEARSKIAQAEQAYPDNSGESQETTADQVMLVEAWHLPSGQDAQDGRHTIACSSGVILDEAYTEESFPFVFIHYSPRLVGFWGQGLAEQLMGTQVEINKLLVTISQSISLVGVPRVFVEDGSKVVKAHLNNNVGSIVTYRGTKPEYEVAPCVPAELYAQLQRLVDYAYQQSGISALAASAQKPAGLNSGEAIRNYDDIQSDRFAVLNKRYDNLFVDLAYKIVTKAAQISEREGSYQTVYPNKDGTEEIELPNAKELLEDPFVIQCYESSSLPKEPAGRLQKITEMMQAGVIDADEGRRLLGYPDLAQSDKLAAARKERIFQILDDIIDTGKYTPPDPYIDIMLAKQYVVDYYNMYAAAKLEESKLQMLRDWQSQVLTLEQEAMPPPMPGAMPGQPAQPGQQAVPQAPPTSDLLPQGAA